MLGAEPALRREAGVALAEQWRIRRQMTGDVAERDRRAAGPVAMDHDAVDDFEILGRGLQQRPRHIQRLGAHLQRRRVGGAAGHHRGPRGVRPDPVLDAVGLAEHDAHPAVIDPQRLGADLRHCRGDALPDRRPAGHQFDRAGRIDRHPGPVERPETALLDEDRQAGSDQLAGFAAAAQILLQRVPADPRQRLVEQTRVVAGIVPHLGAERAQGPGKRHLGRPRSGCAGGQ